MAKNKKEEEKDISNFASQPQNEQDDDIVIEVDDDAKENQTDERNGFENNSLKKFRDKLKKCTAEKQEYLNGWQRSRADLINAKKDFEEQKKDFADFAKGDLIIQIIPVLDSFDMAFSNTENVPEGWLSGIKHIYNQLISVLENNGVKQIDPIGKKFDINEHISVETVKFDDKSKESIIVEVVQKGYSLNGKIIREARVKVGEFEK